MAAQTLGKGGLHSVIALSNPAATIVAALTPESGAEEIADLKRALDHFSNRLRLMLKRDFREWGDK